MKNYPITISFSKNSPSLDSESVSSSNLHTGSSSHPYCHIPPPEHFTLVTPTSKKPRGRPPGSKNKPKPNYFPLAQPIDPIGRPIIINVPPGGDVIDYIVDIAHRSHVSVAILSATGNVASVTIRHVTRGIHTLALHGPFTLISLNGSYIYNNEYTLYPGAAPPTIMSFGINLSTSQGQVFGGAVGGRVVAAADGIQVVLTPFRNPAVYKQFSDVEEIDDHHNPNNYDDNNCLINFSESGTFSGYSVSNP